MQYGGRGYRIRGEPCGMSTDLPSVARVTTRGTRMACLPTTNPGDATASRRAQTQPVRNPGRQRHRRRRSPTSIVSRGPGLRSIGLFVAGPWRRSGPGDGGPISVSGRRGGRASARVAARGRPSRDGDQPGGRPPAGSSFVASFRHVGGRRLRSATRVPGGDLHRTAGMRRAPRRRPRVCRRRGAARRRGKGDRPPGRRSL